MSGADDMRRLTADLTTAPKRVQAHAVEAARKAGMDIQAGAKARVPVDTGFLRNSISTADGWRGNTYRVEVGPTANYAAYVENGTSRQRAQPYLRPATDAVIPGFQAAVGQITGDMLRG